MTEVFSNFLEALTILVRCNLNAETFRSLALFITYALHKPGTASASTPRSRNGTLTSRLTPSLRSATKTRSSSIPAIQQPPGIYLTKRQIGTGVLEIYTELLCETGNTSNLKKFATTVTNKVCQVGLL